MIGDNTRRVVARRPRGSYLGAVSHWSARVRRLTRRGHRLSDGRHCVELYPYVADGQTTRRNLHRKAMVAIVRLHPHWTEAHRVPLLLHFLQPLPDLSSKSAVSCGSLVIAGRSW